MKIGERIQQLRKSKKFKQKDMAEKLGIAGASYSKIETGKIELTLKNLKKVAEIFNVSLDYIVFGTESTVNPYTINDITDTDTDKGFISLEDFGDYAGTIGLMIKEMKNDEAWMHHIFALYFLEKQKQVAAAVGGGGRKK